VVEGKPKGSSLLPLSSLYTYIIIATSSRHHEITITITINPPPLYQAFAYPESRDLLCGHFHSSFKAVCRSVRSGVRAGQCWRKSATRAMRIHQFSCSFAPEWERIESNDGKYSVFAAQIYCIHGRSRWTRRRMDGCQWMTGKSAATNNGHGAFPEGAPIFLWRQKGPGGLTIR
jgi:hypothetical protein